MKEADLEVSITSIENTHRILDQPNLKRAIILVCNMDATRTNTGNDPADIRRKIIRTPLRQDHLIVQLSLQTATPWELKDRCTNLTIELTRVWKAIKDLKGSMATKVRKLTMNNMSPRKWGKTILMRVRPDKEKPISRTRWIKAVLTNKDLSKLPMKNPFTKAT